MATGVRNKARWAPVSQKTRGQAIQARRLAHGIKSVRAFAEASGVSREAITAAEDGLASANTYQRLEAWLDAFEEETGADVPVNEDLVTFRLSGNFGVDVVVSGPVADIDKLQETVQKLIQGMGQQGTQGTPGQ